jgi:hypothetical protein
VYGAAKLAELIVWSRLHDVVVVMLGLGSGAVTGLLAVGKGAELLLTALAVLAVTRRTDILLLAALAGWTADLALLAVVAAVCGDLGRLLEHGITFMAFACLLAVTYASGEVRTTGIAVFGPKRRPSSHTTRQDLSAAASDLTRPDLPVRRPDVTRQDLPVHGPDVTRQDLPVRRRRPRDG